jgi:tetraacyldisaccharide 4'-kinase
MTNPLEPPSRSHSPWQLFYGGLHTLRRRWYATRARSLSRPVISIGNLHWGGTGKTPLVTAVAAHLRDRGLVAAVLSRGYRGRGKGVRIVSAGEGPLLGPLIAGDEPVLLAGELPGVAVVVSADRFEAGRHALERVAPTPEIFVLDDGFSHLGLRRDLDILTCPATDPYGGGRLFPSGRLREPLRAVERAHGVVLTGAEPGAGEELAGSLRRWGFAGRGFTSRVRPLESRLATGQVLAPPARVLLVTAIAQPERFETDVRTLGFDVLGTMIFPDHHDYPDQDLAEIEEAVAELEAEAVLTTAKDRVKLLGRLDVPLAELPIRAEPEPAFWEWLDERVDELLRRSHELEETAGGSGF